MNFTLQEIIAKHVATFTEPTRNGLHVAAIRAYRLLADALGRGGEPDFVALADLIEEVQGALLVGTNPTFHEQAALEAEYRAIRKNGMA